MITYRREETKDEENKKQLEKMVVKAAYNAAEKMLILCVDFSSLSLNSLMQ